jgi:sec-independent protein translocase protein TatA
MFGLGPTELIIIAVIILLLFGAKRLPEIGKGLGGAINEFKKVKKEISKKDEDDKGHDDNEVPPKKNDQPTLEAKVMNKVMEQVPGVKKAMDVKRKVEQVKKIVK